MEWGDGNLRECVGRAECGLEVGQRRRVMKETS